MKSKLQLLAILTLLSSTAIAADPRLRIEPERPRPGGSLTITYDPVAGPLEKSGALKLVYGFTQFQTQRTPLEAKDGRFATTIAAPSDAVFFWCWVEGNTEDDKDNSGGPGWHTYLYDAKGLPVPGAREERAFMYTLRRQPVDATTVSLMLLDEELRAHPENAVARARLWLLRYEEAGKTVAAKESMLREILDLYGSNLDKPWAYRAATLGYNYMDRNQQAVAVMREFLKRFPENTLMDMNVLDFLGNWGTVADREALAASSKRWRNDDRYRATLFYAYDRSKAEPAQLLKAGKDWAGTRATGKGRWRRKASACSRNLAFPRCRSGGS